MKTKVKKIYSADDPSKSARQLEADLAAKDAQIVERDAEIDKLRALVTKDELTGVLNRRGFFEELNKIFDDIHFAKKHAESRKHFFIDSAALLYIDVDNFKPVNDIFGHAAGDNLLKKIVSLMEKEVRRVDFIGRLGGDEFGIVLVGSSADGAFMQAEKIRHIVAKSIMVPKKRGKKSPKVTLSIGVVSSDDADTPEKFIERADFAMYEAKHDHGGNKVIRYLEV
ncbi:MAG: GGDEF domain-containing protein [Candidatus Niyogibacteria bacterium]|nr:GGDEF domain-containing protein [Candidatus Niyogibacteria bacterium]